LAYLLNAIVAAVKDVFGLKLADLVKKDEFGTTLASGCLSAVPALANDQVLEP